MNLAWWLKFLAVMSWVMAVLWLAAWGALGHPLIATFGALFILFPHAPLMAVEFCLLTLLNRNDPAPVPTRTEKLRAWALEVLAAKVVFGWRAAFHSARFTDLQEPVSLGRRGVVLVHGYVCNRGAWNPWWPQLGAAKVPCIAVDLEPLFGSIDAYTSVIEDAVERMRRATGTPPVLVAHSMGGLAVRAWLRKYEAGDRVYRVVTIGTPHYGTWLARWGATRNAREMRPGGSWLTSLAEQESAATYNRFICFHGHCDNVVFPCSTATLPGADNRHLRATAHLSMLQHPKVLTEVLRLASE